MFFYFLWDDPLFAPDSSFMGDGLDDEEFRLLRREARLVALSTLYIKMSNLEKRLAAETKAYMEAFAREVWTIKQFRGLVEQAKTEQILIDRTVNEMDPDFSWRKAIGVAD